MTSAAILSPAARRDFLAAIRWITKDNPAAALAFHAAVIAATGRIGEHPHLGVTRPDLAREHFRFLAVPRFPYVMVYNIEHRPPLVMRVLHGARDLPKVLRGL